MNRNISVQRQIWLAFLFMGLLVGIISLSGLLQTNRLSDNVITFSGNSLPSISGLWKINEGHTQIESSERALLDRTLVTYRRQAEVARIQSVWQQINAGFKQYLNTPRSTEEENALERFQADWDRWKQMHEQYMRLNQQGALDKMRQQAEINRPAFQAATNSILELLRINEGYAKQATKDANAAISQSRIISILAIIIGLATPIFLAVFFSNIIERLNKLLFKVQQSGIQITSSTTQIAASGKELEATIGKELVNTMTNITSMVNNTARESEKGQESLERMENTMNQMTSSTSSVSARLGGISEKANNINNIITTITKVADQTNLLFLNAAIEAEKAGEYGQGFAVVAREIRRLADQTAIATLDIEKTVKEMQSAVATGVMEMDKFTKEVNLAVQDVRIISAQFKRIIDEVQNLTPRFEAVNESTTQTAETLGQINLAINHLNEVAQMLRQEIVSFKLNNSVNEVIRT